MGNLTEVVTGDLRALLFWATIGMRKSRGGAYADELDYIIKAYSKAIRFKGLPDKPVWAADISRKTNR